MPDVNTNTTLGDILNSPYHNPLKDGVERAISTTFDELKESFLNVLRSICRNVERFPKETFTQNEDEITNTIVIALNAAGYNATHDAMHGGHCDIEVALEAPNVAGVHTWLAEAKFDTHSGYIYKGFQQLFHRYSSGSYSQSHGGILVYIKKPNASHIMGLWKNYLKKKENNNYRESPDKLPPLHFRSIHVHPKSGLDFTIDHLPIMVHFDPKD